MTTRFCLLLATIFCFLSSYSATVNVRKLKEGVNKPNVVLIVGDDIGVGDVGYLNPKSLAKTPYLNEMASSSNTIVLSNFHSEAACTPTRAALLTGRSPLRDCAWTAAILKQPAMAYDMPSIIKILRDKYQYRTLFLGKWPAGSDRGNPLSFPDKFGFTDYVVTNGGTTYNSACTCYNLNNVGSCSIGHYSASYLKKFIRDIPCWRITSPNGQQYVEKPNTMDTELMADEFINWVNNIKDDNSEHYFAQISFRSVHIPFVASPKLREDCQNNIACNNIGRLKSSIELDYGGVISSVDSAIGRIREAIRSRLDSENTILIFVSDNGPEANFRGGTGSAGPLRGRKETLFEGLLRVPALLEWPKKIQTNRESFALASVLDIPMTILDILQYVEEDPRIVRDGVSLIPIIEQTPQTSTDDVYPIRAKPLMVCTCSNIGQVKRAQGCVSIAHYSTDGRRKLIGNRANPILSPLPSYIVPNYYFNLTKEGTGELVNLVNQHPTTLSSDSQETNEWLASLFRDFAINCPGYYKRRRG